VREHRYVEAGDLLAALRAAEPSRSVSRRLEALIGPGGELASLSKRYEHLQTSLELFNGDDAGWDVMDMGGGGIVAATSRLTRRCRTSRRRTR
jgi:hypothetical protein